MSNCVCVLPLFQIRYCFVEQASHTVPRVVKRQATIRCACILCRGWGDMHREARSEQPSSRGCEISDLFFINNRRRAPFMASWKTQTRQGKPISSSQQCGWLVLSGNLIATRWREVLIKLCAHIQAVLGSFCNLVLGALQSSTHWLWNCSSKRKEN